ncbi:metal-dependent transcriptional regulator [Erysipelotrichaceae bacterium HCN-30851]
MILGESLEDYLETLLILGKENEKIRCVDVAKRMNVSKPSVNKAMNVLKEKGYVQQETYGDIHFTPEGKELAEKVYQRHTTVQSFLQHVLGVDEETAEEEACHIEHVISEDTFIKIKDFLENYTSNKD